MPDRAVVDDVPLAPAQDDAARCLEHACALHSALLSMVEQFAYETSKDGAPAYFTGGLSALEEAFSVLGWSDPQPADPDAGCDVPGCPRFSSMGTPTPDGYKRFCGTHGHEYWLTKQEVKS